MWLPLQMKGEKELRVITDAFSIVFAIQIVWEQWHFKFLNGNTYLPKLWNVSYHLWAFWAFCSLCSGTSASSGISEQEIFNTFSQRKNLSFTQSAGGSGLPGLGWTCHICNTYRKTFPSSKRLPLNSHSPAYLHGSSSGVVLWAVPGTEPARVSWCTAVPGGRRRSEQLQQPDFLRSSALQNCSLRAGRQLRVFWRVEEQWGKMHAVL